jgi:hypothetical protein
MIAEQFGRLWSRERQQNVAERPITLSRSVRDLPAFPDTVKPDDSRLQADPQASAKLVGYGLHAGYANVSMGLIRLQQHIGAVDGYDPAGPLCDDFLLNPGLDIC